MNYSMIGSLVKKDLLIYRRYFSAASAHWNSTSIAIIAGQVFLSIAVLWATLLLQLRKRDFV